MAHLSPKKGAFPNKDQHDRTCPVSASIAENLDTLQRGSVLYVNKNGEFEIADKADGRANYPFYLCLQDGNDLQATMAGFFSVGKGDPNPFDAKGLTVHDSNDHPQVLSRVPSVSGIHMDDGDVWQTDMFDEAATYEIGDPVTIGDDGRITKSADPSTDKILGYVTKTPYTRYANDAKVIPGFMTGGQIRVIDFQCGR